MLSLTPALPEDYPCLQNMARFYAYDLSRSCGFISADWNFPEDGLYECMDFERYFHEPHRQPFWIKNGDELAGFVLIDKEIKSPQSTWNMGEFFLIAKFQGKGLGTQIAHEVWKQFPGIWEVCVIPENKPAFAFWTKAIEALVGDRYTQTLTPVDYDQDQPFRHVFILDTNTKPSCTR